jgi:hypothetical protein
MQTFEQIQTLLLANPKINRIPIFKDIPADLLTPVSAYLKLTATGMENSFLLVSPSFLTRGRNQFQEVRRSEDIPSSELVLIEFYASMGTFDDI